MNLEKLTGGAAVGAGVVVWLTHSGDFTVEEIVAMSVGLGSAITYAVGVIERVFNGIDGRE